MACIQTIQTGLGLWPTVVGHRWTGPLQVQYSGRGGSNQLNNPQPNT